MGARQGKIRLDRLLVERGFCPTQERAQSLIMSGVVLVAENRVDKAGALISVDAEIRLQGQDNPYVSRGGLKLKGALDQFQLTVQGCVILDVGASTGGFTDCLLQAGARKVYALDVGYGQLAWKLREDPRVICMERINIRHFDGRGIDILPDMATIDVSFISLKLVLPVVERLIVGGGRILALIKPQFEVGRQEVGDHGVVREPALHTRVIDEIASFERTLGLAVVGTFLSPLTGPAGNQEFFLLAEKPGSEDSHGR
jgi:23S rRNA (cytidine1920-2'-O)/16S rRNA (cytidine1409-2'-O)-methyltransferase